jgi:hypothetical protein
MHADTAKPANPVVNMDESPGSCDGAECSQGTSAASSFRYEGRHVAEALINTHVCNDETAQE